MLRTIRNITRLIMIACILMRHDVLLFWRSDKPDKGKRIARALHEMGPTFIKLGQALSTRSDLVGDEVALELAQFQDRLPPFSTGTVKAIIGAQLGKPVSEIFASFSNDAAAAASIAQVHFATLHDGRDVAVKVLRPGIEHAFAQDIALFYWLAELGEYWRPDWRRFHLIEVVRSFEDTIRFELDLRFEAAASVELKANLTDPLDFYVPDVVWDLTARAVMVQERIHGIPISDVEGLRRAGHDPKVLVDKAAVGFFNQVFRDGFFHADLHPGNLLVRGDGRIALVDFGIMGRLDKKTRLYLAQILHGFLTEDYLNLSRVHFDNHLVPPHKSVESFALALMAITKPIINRKLADISLSRLLGQLFTTAETFEMEVQPHLLLLQKNMMIAEGVGRMLNPDINMWQVTAPLIEAWAKENLGVKSRLKDHKQEMVEAIKSLPELFKKAEAALNHVSEVDIRLGIMLKQRGRFHREWLWFAWATLIVFIIAHST